MKVNIFGATILLISTASSAFATGPLSDRASEIDRIIQGHGRPGDTATAKSDGSVSFEVLPNGLVQRKDAKYGIVTILDPKADAALRRSR